MVAIVIPTYNVEKYIGSMLDSIIAQSYKEWSLFVVDDGSTDNTYNIIESYSKKDNRIHVKRRDRLPKGAQTCRNIGLELASASDYVIFFDGDDLIAPYCLQQRVLFMEQHPDIDFAVFPAKAFTVKPNDSFKIYYGFKIFEGSDLLSFFWDNVPFVVWNNIYRVEAIRNYSICWDEKVLSLQDSDFNINSILRNLKYLYSQDSKIDYYYRILNNSTSIKARSKAHMSSHSYLIGKILNNLLNNDDKCIEKGLKHYIIVYAKMFAMNDAHDEFSLMLSNKWFYKRTIYTYKLRLFFLLLNGRYSERLFIILMLFLFPLLSIQRKNRRHIQKTFFKNVYDDLVRCYK